jgi:3-hydroxy-D-aspartate aldolase
MKMSEIPTPALLVDIEAFDSIVERMASLAKASGKKLRPHAKAHKCIEVAKRQIAAGAIGVCAATVPEAELLVETGIPGVLLTSPLADSRKMTRIAVLASIAPDLMVVVDHVDQLRWYAQAVSGAGTALNVLIDLDLGDHRTGILPGEPVLQLARKIVDTPNLRFCGLQAYSVRASHTTASGGRKSFTRDTWRIATDTAELLEKQSIPVAILSGGSTGSCEADATVPQVTELQAGSYVFMDEAYKRIGEIVFANAMTVLATVISATHNDRVTVDAGFKAFSTDRPFGPAPVEPTIAGYDWAGDEFGYVYPVEGSSLPRLGDRIRFIPPHCDPTVNLYDRIYVHRGDEIIDVWPVMDRMR